MKPLVKPLVSIVVPTFNGGDTLPAVLSAIAAQRTDFPFETVAVDSGSTDGTVELLRGRVDRLVQIPPGSFNHGLTRNLGIESSAGELAVLLVQDAVPASDRWLAELAAPFAGDERLGGTFGRQIARPDASPVTRYYLDRWAAASGTPRVASIEDPLRFANLPPMEQVLLCTFDNVCSSVRRSLWRDVPFPKTDIAEDVEWARTVLLAGHRLAYVPSSAVIHSHERSPGYELARTYLVHRRLRMLFGLQTIPTFGLLLRAVAVSAAAHLRCLAREASPLHAFNSELVRSIGLALAFPLGQYLGARSADTGLDYLRAEGV